MKNISEGWETLLPQEVWLPAAEVESGRVDAMCSSIDRSIVLLADLLPHKQIIPEHLREVLQIFGGSGAIPPILIDSRSKTILDGHHRFHIARLREWKTIECLEVDYLRDHDIRVVGSCDGCPITKDHVLLAAHTKTLMSPEASKHFIRCKPSHRASELQALLRTESTQLSHV
jgi:hypothetical protein